MRDDRGKNIVPRGSHRGGDCGGFLLIVGILKRLLCSMKVTFQMILTRLYC